MRKLLMAAAIFGVAIAQAPVAQAGYLSYVGCNFGKWTLIQQKLQGKFGPILGGLLGDLAGASPYSAYVGFTCMV